MAFKERVEKDEIKVLRFLNSRMELSKEDKKNFFRLEKGYEGEVMFDLLTEKHAEDRFLVLNDLQLKVNNNKFQIDSSVLSQDKIHLFEVKNYEGDYEYNPVSNEFSTISGIEIFNPLDQVKRSEFLLRQLLQNLGYNIPIEVKVVFINPEFTLYQAPKNKPIIYSTQLNSFMKKFNSMPSKINGRHIKLAEKLVSLHHVEPPRLPPYKYDQLRKGNTCSTSTCDSLSASVEGNKIVCEKCGAHEKIESAVVRGVEELKLLFPKMKITTNIVFEWSGGVVSKKTIQRILDKYYRKMGINRWSYYE